MVRCYQEAVLKRQAEEYSTILVCRRSETHEGDSYEAWKAAFLAKFTNKADMKHLILKLDTIKMKSTHITQYFVNRILVLYQIIYGDDYDDSPVANN